MTSATGTVSQGRGGVETLTLRGNKFSWPSLLKVRPMWGHSGLREQTELLQASGKGPIVNTIGPVAWMVFVTVVISSAVLA